VTATLILLRHGQSVWNGHNRFTGWVDVALSDAGIDEAAGSATQLRVAHLKPDVVHTSVLRRSIATANVALDAADRHWVPVRRSWRLNERHYGDLQGKNKQKVRAEVGDEQFERWRRSYKGKPPPSSAHDHDMERSDPRYVDLGDALPNGESLEDVLARVIPHWELSIVRDLRAGATVLVVAHSNSLRALIKHLDKIADSDIPKLNVPTGMPLVYELGTDMVPIVRGGRYLEPDAAAVAALAVASEGG
jgi:2,3-bisphosphoglycerate-dependent phosphoglycerate mutase